MKFKIVVTSLFGTGLDIAILTDGHYCGTLKMSHGEWQHFRRLIGSGAVNVQTDGDEVELVEANA